MTDPTPSWYQPVPPVTFALRVTYGSAPGGLQEVSVEWGYTVPDQATVATILQQLVVTDAQLDVDAEGVQTYRVARDRQPLTVVRDDDTTYDPMDADTEIIRVCGATLDTGAGHTHSCVLGPDHDPVEPDGRAHRCGCGGIFTATSEDINATASRSDRARR